MDHALGLAHQAVYWEPRPAFQDRLHNDLGHDRAMRSYRTCSTGEIR